MPDKTLLEYLPAGVGLGITGGIAVYLNQIRNGAKFSIFMFAINIFLAGWIGWMANNSIPDTVGIKDSLISISGFLSYPILDLLEKRGVSLFIEKFLGKK